MTESTPQEPVSTRPGGLRRFAVASAAFLGGLVLTLGVTDRLLGRVTVQHHGFNIIGTEVYQALSDAHRHDDRTRFIVLGDSVARQLFYHGTEPGPMVEYLTANQAITIAGQYFLLRDALHSCANVTDVYLFYTPRSWANNLDGRYTHDYFCGFFHTPGEILEIARLKRDCGLTAAQIGRALLPNIMAANSKINVQRPTAGPDFAPQPGNATAVIAGSGEPLLDAGTTMLHWTDPVPTGPALPGNAVPNSAISQVYIFKMRSLCDARHVTLHVLPCPCTDAHPYAATPTPYTAPLWYMPASSFVPDQIHLKWPLIKGVRQDCLTRYGIHFS